jgi:hypothetical protein
MSGKALLRISCCLASCLPSLLVEVDTGFPGVFLEAERRSFFASSVKLLDKPLPK